MNDAELAGDAQTDPDRTPDFYVNQVGISISPFDLAMTWGRRWPDGTIQPLVRTTMSLEHSVTVYAILGRLLKQYFSESETRAVLSPKVLADLDIKAEELPW